MGGGRSPCCDKSKVKRGPWSPAEDVRLVSFIQKHGHPNWRSLPKQAGLLRCGKSCRLRWINYLRPDVKRGNFTSQEEHTIIHLHATFGNKWSKIAAQLPGRTDNEIKNVWNTHLKKRSLLKNINDQVEHPKSIEEAQGAISVEDIITIDQPSTPSSTISCDLDQNNNCFCDETIANKNSVPLESEAEFWNMLDPESITAHDNRSCKHQEMDIEYWVRLLEDELGLVSPSQTGASQQVDQNDQTKTKDDKEQTVSEIWCQISDQISPFWPTSPQNFGF